MLLQTNDKRTYFQMNLLLIIQSQQNITRITKEKCVLFTWPEKSTSFHAAIDDVSDCYHDDAENLP